MTATDPSRAAERTALAWNRTGLSFVAVGAAVLRALAPSGRGAVGLVMIVVGSAAAVHAWRPRSGENQVRAIRLLAFATTLMAVAVFVAAVAP
jgi:uncharacterized membrane protein YidH (DUF202 family)